jgi:DnaJ-class molecular chaperone
MVVNHPRKFRYYEILEVRRRATQEEIKQAYIRLAKLYHPDVSPGTQEKFKKINESYEVLSDHVKRAAYDSSPVECPVCWTYEVIQSFGSDWRCRHCGCKFDLNRPDDTVIEIEKAAISDKERRRINLFQTTRLAHNPVRSCTNK